MSQKQQFTREEVVEIIENMLQHSDAVMDAITKEQPLGYAEGLLEMTESSMKFANSFKTNHNG